MVATRAGLYVATWHAHVAAEGDRGRLVGVRAELVHLTSQHTDPACPLQSAGVELLSELAACIASDDRDLSPLIGGLKALYVQSRRTDG